MNSKKAKKLRQAMRGAGLNPGQAPAPLPQRHVKKLSKPLMVPGSFDTVKAVIVSNPLKTSVDRREYKKAKRLYGLMAHT
jgi:hypothetical protein